MLWRFVFGPEEGEEEDAVAVGQQLEDPAGVEGSGATGGQGQKDDADEDGDEDEDEDAEDEELQALGELQLVAALAEDLRAEAKLASEGLGPQPQPQQLESLLLASPRVPSRSAADDDDDDTTDLLVGAGASALEESTGAPASSGASNSGSHSNNDNNNNNDDSNSKSSTGFWGWWSAPTASTSSSSKPPNVPNRQAAAQALNNTPPSRLSAELGFSLRRLLLCRQLANAVPGRIPEGSAGLDLRVLQVARLTAQVSEAATALSNELEVLLEDIEKAQRLERQKKEAAAIALADADRSAQQTKSKGATSSSNESTWTDFVTNHASRLALHAGSQVVNLTGKTIVMTAGLTQAGIKTSVVTTYNICRPPTVAAVKYLITPDGMLNAGSACCALASLQFATASAAMAAAAVGANAGAAALQTSAEVVRATGDTGAIRRALREPSYAKELQKALRARRNRRNRQLLFDRAKTIAWMVNTGVVARVSPTASTLAESAATRLFSTGKWLFWGPSGSGSGASGAQGDGAEGSGGGGGDSPTRNWEQDGNIDALVVGQRSYLLESTRLALSLNTWLSTVLYGRAEALRSSSDHSVEALVGLAGQASEYREKYRDMGWYEASLTAYRDVLTPIITTSASLGLEVGKQAAGAGVAMAGQAAGAGLKTAGSVLYCVAHPFSTAGSIVRGAATMVLGPLDEEEDDGDENDEGASVGAVTDSG